MFLRIFEAKKINLERVLVLTVVEISEE